MDMHTDLIAVPHAGLGFHFLRVQVGKSKEEEEVHPAEVSKVINGASGRQGDDGSRRSVELPRSKHSGKINAAVALY